MSNLYEQNCCYNYLASVLTAEPVRACAIEKSVCSCLCVSVCVCVCASGRECHFVLLVGQKNLYFNAWLIHIIAS